MGPLLGVCKGGLGDTFWGVFCIKDSDGLGTGWVNILFSFSLSLEMSTSSLGASITL